MISLCFFETRKKKEDEILVKIEIQKDANKELVATKKIAEKSTIKQSRELISFDLMILISSKKFMTTRIDKLIAQTIMLQQVNEKVDNFNKKLINRSRCIDERCINETKKN